VVSKAVAALVFRRRGAVVALFAVLLVIAGFALTRLTFDETSRSVFPRGGEQRMQLAALVRDFGTDENDCVIVLEADDLFRHENLAALRRVADEARQLDGALWVTSMCDARWTTSLLVPLIPQAEQLPEAYERIRERALAHPLVAGQFLSPDGRMTLVVVRIAGEELPASDVERRIERLRAVVERCLAGSTLRARITGYPAVRAEVVAALRRDLVRFNLASLGLSLAMAAWLFRNVRGIAIAFLPPVVGTTLAMGVLGLAGETIDVVNAAMPSMILVTGFSDSVHILFNFRRLRSSGIARPEAAHQTLIDMAGACLMTSLTNAFGFGSLAVSRVDIIRGFGIDCAIGCVISYVSVITLAPLLASTWLGDFPIASRPPQQRLRAGLRLSRAVGRLLRFPWATSIISTAVTVVLFWGFTQLRPDYQAFDALPARSEAAQALRDCDRHFGGAMWAYVVVEWPEGERLSSEGVLGAIENVHAAAEAEPLFRSPFSVLNVLEAIPSRGRTLGARTGDLRRMPTDIVRRLVRTDLRKALVAIHVSEAGTWRNSLAYADLEKRLDALRAEHPNFRFTLTGTTVLMARSVNDIIGDLRSSLVTAAITIFGSMTIALWSLRLGLISVVPNVFPLFATGSLLVALGRPLDYASAVVFSICLGIAVDDTIHFLHRFQHELAAGKKLRAAIVRTYVASGAAMAFTNVVYIVGFSALLLSEIPQRRTFALLSCLAMGLALLGDLVMLPSMLLCLARKPSVVFRSAKDSLSRSERRH
jgi:predicted RND superfamily exporter protein